MWFCFPFDEDAAHRTFEEEEVVKDGENTNRPLISPRCYETMNDEVF